MPQPGDASQPQPSAEDSFLDLLVETLDGLDESVRGQFLRQFFRTIAQIDFTDAQSNEYWERILLRRRELAENLGKRVSLKTAMVDVLASTNFLRVPILMEYDEFKKLQINAATDALTGLYNRRLFDEYCDKELNRAKRYGQQLAIVILDLHKLKEVNDRHGHLQGDQVLQLAAATLRKTMRASDFAFRIGGDEFALAAAADRSRTGHHALPPRSHPIRKRHSVAEIGPWRHAGFRRCCTPAGRREEKRTDEPGRRAALRTQECWTRRAPSGAAQTQATREIPASSQPAQREAPAPAAPQTIRPPVTMPPAKTEVAPPQTPLQTPPQAPSEAARPAATCAEERKWERVSLAGTKAYAVLTDVNQKTATVVDLSYGGVALLMEKPEDVPNQFNAVLHVPILPPVRVVLRKTNTQRIEGGRARVGCSFVS